MSPQAVSKWERGENAPDIGLLVALSKLLGVSVDWILGVGETGRDVFEASVLVSSVAGAYEKSLQMRARDFAIWANGLFYQMTELTLRHDGVPVKYMGDRFLAFFSSTLHRERALLVAKEAKTLIGPYLSVGLNSVGNLFDRRASGLRPARHHGETVNIAFLTMEWAESKAAAASPRQAHARWPGNRCDDWKAAKVNFMGSERPVEVCEIVFEAKAKTNRKTVVEENSWQS